MKRIFILLAAVMTLTACENAMPEENEQEIEGGGKKFTFTVKGDFGSPIFKEPDADASGSVANTRSAYLAADGQDMNDLWVFDFVGDSCVQHVHQVKDDDDFGTPSMKLACGTHHVYFVASRGKDALLDTYNRIITWDKPSDTFWKDYEVTVVNTSNGNRAVSLDRVATKLKITISDEVPAGIASIGITPATWYFGINYVTGAPAGVVGSSERVISVPSSYVGTSGQLSVSIFGMSSVTEWSTSVVISAKYGNGDVIGSASISSAAFKANRATEYTGELFKKSASEGFSASLNTTWLSASAGTF